MLKIKLSRTGKKNQPSYRIVVAEARSKRDGQVTDTIGFYNPLSTPPTLKLDAKRYQYWLNHGAQPTNTIKNLAKGTQKP